MDQLIVSYVISRKISRLIKSARHFVIFAKAGGLMMVKGKTKRRHREIGFDCLTYISTYKDGHRVLAGV